MIIYSKETYGGVEHTIAESDIGVMIREKTGGRLYHSVTFVSSLGLTFEETDIPSESDMTVEDKDAAVLKRYRVIE